MEMDCFFFSIRRIANTSSVTRTCLCNSLLLSRACFIKCYYSNLFSRNPPRALSLSCRNRGSPALGLAKVRGFFYFAYRVRCLIVQIVRLFFSFGQQPLAARGQTGFPKKENRFESDLCSPCGEQPIVFKTVYPTSDCFLQRLLSPIARYV